MASPFLSTTTTIAPPARRRSPRLVLQEEDRDWSTLPEELLEQIGQMLPSRREALKFRSICPTWRAGLPFDRYIAPLLMRPFGPDSPDDDVTFFTTAADGGERTFTRNLPSLRGKALRGSSRGWLALVDDQAASLALLNPLTGATVELPPADEHVVAASGLHYESDDAVMHDGQWVIEGNFINLDDLKMSAVFHQIVLSSSSPTSGDCLAMAALEGSSTVAFCRVGVDASWTLLDTDPLIEVTSVLHFGGSRFLAIYSQNFGGEISICNVAAGGDPTATLVPFFYASPKPIWYWPRHHYMEVNGKLYLVGTNVQGSTHLTLVYKTNVLAAKPTWTRVKNAGDLTLFTDGYGGAPSVSGFNRNSVYSTGPNPDGDHFELEIIDIANGTSEFQPFPKKIQVSAGTPCWIQPNHWT